MSFLVLIWYDCALEGLVVPDDILIALRDAARITWQDFDVSWDLLLDSFVNTYG
jgi:hypothetical protein